MAKAPDNTVTIDVIKVKGKPFYATIGPGGSVLAANPMYDPVTGDKEMTQQEVYHEYEKLIMLDEHIKNPDHYEVLNTYLAPDNMDMYAAIDMRKRSAEESKNIILESTRV